MTVRVGFGYDVHRFVEGRRLILGGLEIPHSMGLDGHSDADVVLHAISDAMLGAAGQGDIGEHFPPDNPAWLDADSAELLQRVRRIVGSKWAISNLDVVIIAEHPKIGPFRETMRGRVADLLELEVDQVSIKATTNEGMGFVGREEGIAAMATVLLVAALPG